MTSDKGQAVEEFFRRWAISFEELIDSYRWTLGEHGVWVAGPPPIPVTHSGEEAVGLLEGFKKNYDLSVIEVELLHIGTSEDIVFSERIDHLVDSAGKRFISLEVAGVMQLDEEGHLTHWRDYWDAREFFELPSR